MKRSLLFVFLLLQKVYGETIAVSTWDELNNTISGGLSYANQPNISTTIQSLGDITHSNTDSTIYLVPFCIDSPNSSFNLLDQCQIMINVNFF